MSDTRTVDLASWLTRIWDEEERLATAAPQQPWFSTLETGDDAENFGSVWINTDGSWKNAETVADWYKPGAGEHIAAHDPASVLARIAADRKILELHSYRMVASLDSHFKRIPGTERPRCNTCASQDENGEWWPCETVRLLASPYKGREGWQEEWAL